MRGPRYASRKGLMRRIAAFSFDVSRDWYVYRSDWQPSAALRNRTRKKIVELRSLLDELEAKL